MSAYRPEPCAHCGIPDWADTDAEFLAQLAGEPYDVVCDWCEDELDREPWWLLPGQDDRQAVTRSKHYHGFHRMAFPIWPDLQTVWSIDGGP